MQCLRIVAPRNVSVLVLSSKTAGACASIVFPSIRRLPIVTSVGALFLVSIFSSTSVNPSGRMREPPSMAEMLTERSTTSVSVTGISAPTIIELFVPINEYLTAENLSEGVVRIEDLTPIKADDRIYIWQGDMSRLAIDAVTLPANSGFTGCYQWLHSCLDNILGSKAGVELRLYTNKLITEQGYPEPTGQAKITPGFNLPSKYIIHTVGPIVQGHLTKENERMLASCYRSILELADQNDIKTLALCCISTGVFMFPNQRAAEIAVETVRKYLAESGSQIKVIFNVFKNVDYLLYRDLLS